MCIENNIKADAQVIINNWTIYSLVENTTVSESSEYYKNVWLFLRHYEYLYYYGSSLRWTTLQTVEKRCSIELTSHCFNNETSGIGCKWAAL